MRFYYLIEKILMFNLDLWFIYIVRDLRVSIYFWISNLYEFLFDVDVNVEWKIGCCRK